MIFNFLYPSLKATEFGAAVTAKAHNDNDNEHV